MAVRQVWSVWFDRVASPSFRLREAAPRTPTGGPPAPARRRRQRIPTTGLSVVALLAAILTVIVPGSPAQAAGSVVASVASAAITEGDTGPARLLQVPVTLSAPATVVSTVDFAITHGNTSPGDLGLRTGTLKFIPDASGKSKTVGTIAVKVVPDTIDETNEGFIITLSNPTGDITLGTTSAVGIIVDDDPGPGGPVVSVTYTTIVEGDQGRTPGAVNNAEIPITLSEPAAVPVSVTVTVSAGTATAGPGPGADFKKPYSKTITFNPGQTTKTVAVGVWPDTTDEPHETVTVALSAPLGAVIGTGAAALVIMNDDDLDLYTWGFNGYGQLGDGTTTHRTTPTLIGGGDWVGVSTAGDHTVAVRTDGTLWAWGRNNYGQLGLGDTADRLAPTRIGTDTNWAKVAAGGYHTVAIRTDGTLWYWGYDGSTYGRWTPLQIGTDSDWASVTAGEYHSMGIKTDGSLWAAGGNFYGQLGTGDDIDRFAPVRIGTDSNWAKVEAGQFFTVAVRTDGTLWAWGRNDFGQLGTGDTTDRWTPVEIGTDTNWASVAAGVSHTVAIRTDGSLWAWGYNGLGQLGTGDTTTRLTPTQIGTDTNWVGVDAGGYHTVAIRSVP
jgi:alpha-tubulin suppressor-like RCC1 family protein